MLKDKLFKKVLLKPQKKHNRLLIATGYASPAMVFRHFAKLNPNIKVSLIVGKVISDGIYQGQHDAFCSLKSEHYPGRFDCKYYIGDPAGLHAKAYLWCKAKSPSLGFLGSANYSQNGFLSKQIETMTNTNPKTLMSFFDEIEDQSKPCDDKSILDFISVSNKPILQQQIKLNAPKGNNHVTLSLLIKGGITPPRSGINWGQREGRDPNQAYLSVPIKIQRTNFFPPLGDCFVIYTDDGTILDCKRAQAQGKAIETYRNNSILGCYIRNRIGVPTGKFVTKEDLKRYGRSDITIYKIDPETYYMDFSI